MIRLNLGSGFYYSPGNRGAFRGHLRRRRDCEADEIASGSVVYFVEAASVGLIKIGLTGRGGRSTLDLRMSALRSGSPVPLVLLGATPGAACLERYLHIKFRALRSHGEWFRGAPPLRRFIAERTQGAAARCA